MSTGTQRRMTAQEFEAVALAVWGPRFGGQAAADLGVTRRTVHNYAIGTRTVPHRVASHLLAAVRRRLQLAGAAVAVVEDVAGVDTQPDALDTLSALLAQPAPAATQGPATGQEFEGPEGEEFDGEDVGV
jgi:hypothetical protein